MGEIRFVGTGETRGYSYLVCKNYLSQPAIEAMHGPHSVFWVWTNRVNQPYSHTAEVFTKDTGVV